MTFGGVEVILMTLQQAMAEAVRTLLKADIGISTTGIEETEERPMGIIYIGIADAKSSKAISGPQPQRKQRVTSTALFELRKLLLSLDSGK